MGKPSISQAIAEKSGELSRIESQLAAARKCSEIASAREFVGERGPSPKDSLAEVYRLELRRDGLQRELRGLRVLELDAARQALANAVEKLQRDSVAIAAEQSSAFQRVAEAQNSLSAADAAVHRTTQLSEQTSYALRDAVQALERFDSARAKDPPKTPPPPGPDPAGDIHASAAAFVG